MSKLDKDQVIAKFTEAYTATHGKAPEIEAKGGWYSVDGGKNVRLAQLEEMIADLSGSAAPAKKAKAEPKVKAAPKAEAAPAKKAAPKKAAPAKKAAKKKSDFSVKALWAQQIEEKNPGSRAPR